MDKPRSMELSELLSKLSQQAKKVEDGFADLAVETDAAAAERRDRAQAAARAASDQLDKNMTSARDATTAEWQAMNAKIDEQIKSIQADIAKRKREREISQAVQNAEAAKERAAWAADFAAAAVETANLAALDYDVARREAAAIKHK